MTAAPADSATVLIIDDEAPIRSALERYLSGAGYRAIAAESAEAALQVLQLHPAAAAVCDIRMPGMSGVDFLAAALARDPDIAVIMLTAVGDPEVAIQCLRGGASDYLIKPVELEELGLVLAAALRRRTLELERRHMEQWLAREVKSKTHQLEEQQRRIEQLSLSVLGALVAALEPLGAAGRTHSVRVAQLAGHLASALGLDPGVVRTVQTAGRIHDIGRLALRGDLLAEMSGPTELVGSRHEGEMAMRLLEPLRHNDAVLEVVRCQHERWDGRGPQGLRGDAIPVGARVLAAANLYDELVDPVGGGARLTPEEALSNMRGLSGTLLDPATLPALRQLMGRETAVRVSP